MTRTWRWRPLIGVPTAHMEQRTSPPQGQELANLEEDPINLPLDEERYEPLLAAMDELGAGVWLHPHRTQRSWHGWRARSPRRGGGSAAMNCHTGRRSALRVSWSPWMTLKQTQLSMWCPVCGAELPANGRRGPRRTYCGEACLQGTQTVIP